MHKILKKMLLKMSRSSDKVYMFICIRMDTEYIVHLGIILLREYSVDAVFSKI